MSDRGVVAGLPYLANLIVMNNGRGDRIHVLFVEDEPEDVKLTVRLLEQYWYKVAWYSVQTESALFLALSQDDDPFDFILCDFVMPNLTAVRALEVYQASRQAYIPFIVISGTVKADSELEVLKRGAHDFVIKPRPNHPEDKDRLIWVIKREIRRVGKETKDRVELTYSYDMTIEAFGKALELRDKFTQGHTLRVTDMTLRFARLLNSDLSHEEFVNIHRGALTHDLGKLGLADSILLKKGPLTDEERKTMQKHPTLAYEMLSHIPFLVDSVTIPYCHHEKFDGTGYPRGLKGEQIPLAARMFSLVDVWDAITSDRPYRKGWTKEQALDYIQSESGKSFDPALVPDFIKMIIDA